MSLSCFSCRPSTPVKLKFGDVGFCRERKIRLVILTQRKTLEASWETNKNSTYIWQWARILLEPVPCWWQTSTFTTAPYLLPFMWLVSGFSTCIFFNPSTTTNFTSFQVIHGVTQRYQCVMVWCIKAQVQWSSFESSCLDEYPRKCC